MTWRQFSTGSCARRFDVTDEVTDRSHDPKMTIHIREIGQQVCEHNNGCRGCDPTWAHQTKYRECRQLDSNNIWGKLVCECQHKEQNQESQGERNNWLVLLSAPGRLGTPRALISLGPLISATSPPWSNREQPTANDGHYA